VVTGPFGYPKAGLKILTGEAEAEPEFREAATTSVLRPSPNLAVGFALAPFLTSSMDSSDGLARSMHALAKASRVGFWLTSLPTGAGVGKFASANNLDADRMVLEGGEEYVIVGTIRRSKVEEARRAAMRAGGQLLVIGSATSRVGRVELRVGGTVRAVRDEGWTHLR
jgi:thiamine-monophosphate kinase